MMSRPASRKKSETSQAIADLRALLGDSQQAFSNRLGLALNTIQRYEMGREPTGQVLLDMGHLAAKVGDRRLVRLFGKKYLESAPKSGLLMIPGASDEPAVGYVTQKLCGDRQIWIAQIFLRLNNYSKLEENKELMEAIRKLDSLAREGLAKDISDALRLALTMGKNPEDYPGCAHKRTSKKSGKAKP
jgi:transcriptional regulator with XRE-family HTH domain